MDTIHESTSVPSNVCGTINNLLFGREPSRISANSNCILIEPIKTPNVRTIIPLNQILSVRPCYCSRKSNHRRSNKQKLTCDCDNGNNFNGSGTLNMSSTSSSVSTSSNDQSKSRSDENGSDTNSRSTSSPSKSSSDGGDTKSGLKKNKRSKRSGSENVSKGDTMNLKCVNIYYGVAVGEFRWKVTCVTLKLQSDVTKSRTSRKRESKGKKIDPEKEEQTTTHNNELDTNGNNNYINNILNWISNVNYLLQELKGRPKKLLIFINPFGGKRLAPKIYKSKVEPLLSLSGINYSAVLTERADHAKDMLQNVDLPLKDFDGFICIGGDGMFAELINGIIIRTQLEQSVDYNHSGSDLMQPNVPIGVIPAGSTDAVAFGVTGINDPVTSTLHIIFGNRVDIDVSAIHSINEGDKLIRYATSFLGYGYFGDVLVDSERNRWMGPSRYDWAGFKKLLQFKRYEGEIKLFTSNVDGSPKDNQICSSDCNICSRTGQRRKYLKSSGSEDNMSSTTSTLNDGDVSIVSIKGRFLAVNCATMSCRCDKTKKGMSPSAHLGNGCCDLILVSDCSRINYLKFLMRTGFLATSAFDLPFVDVYRVRGFEYYPLDTSDTSAWNCDGEIISQPSLRVKIHCQLLPVFGAGRENRSRDSSSKSGLLSKLDQRKKLSKVNPVVVKKDKNLNHKENLNQEEENSEGISTTTTGGTNQIKHSTKM